MNATNIKDSSEQKSEEKITEIGFCLLFPRSLLKKVIDTPTSDGCCSPTKVSEDPADYGWSPILRKVLQNNEDSPVRKVLQNPDVLQKMKVRQCTEGCPDYGKSFRLQKVLKTTEGPPV